MKGFTLIEVMMSTALIMVVLTVTMMYLSSMSDSIGSEMTQSVLEVNSTRQLTELVETLVDGKVIDPPPAFDSSYVKIKQPAGTGDPGDVGYVSVLDKLTADPPVSIWGVRVPGLLGEGNGWLEYYYDDEPTSEVLDESVIGDVNGDLDTDDVFVRGWLWRRWWLSDTQQEKKQPFLRVVQRQSSLTETKDFDLDGDNDPAYTTAAGDIDDDGNPDPIFRMDAGGKVLTISLWLYGRDERRRPFLHNVTTQVALRNQN